MHNWLHVDALLKLTDFMIFCLVLILEGAFVLLVVLVLILICVAIGKFLQKKGLL